MEKLTPKQIATFNDINDGDLTLWANEYKMNSWYLDKTFKKVRVAYGTYLAFFYNHLIYEVSSDIEECIFGYKLIHQ